MSASPGRLAALEVVTRVREREAYAHETLDAVLRARTLSEQDAATATRIAYGTIQSVGTLDEALIRYVKRPTRVEPRVRDALMIAVWEILFSQTPAPVAVDEGVELVRSVRPAAAGLANAVLRRVADDAQDFPWHDDPAEAFAARHAHPLWIARLLVEEYGDHTAASIMAANNLPAPLYLAHNPFMDSFPHVVATLEQDHAEPEPCSPPGCIKAGSPSSAIKSRALAAGHVVVCDAAAQVAASLAAAPGGLVVEVGSGRGTKTLLIQASSSRTGDPARIHAIESHEFKARMLGERLQSLGVDGVTIHNLDATDLSTDSSLPGPGTVDRVLIDAPCTGLGTLRRHPDKRWRIEPGDVARLAEIGSALLTESAHLVRPGGFVVYSTCTLTRRENAGVVEGFLSSELGSEFALLDVSDVVPGEYGRFVSSEGWFQSVPETGGPDGHFIACLLRAPAPVT